MMIKVSELRIGNKVELYGTIATVGRLDFSTGLAIDKGEPIRISEHWLIKFGFEKDLSQLDPPDTPNGNFWPEYEKEGVRIYLPFFEYSHDEINIEIKHVHQLQNLYFALTGNELIIK